MNGESKSASDGKAFPPVRHAKGMNGETEMSITPEANTRIDRNDFKVVLLLYF